MDPHFVCDSTTRPGTPFEVQGKQKAGDSNKERQSRLTTLPGQRLNRFNMPEKTVFSEGNELEVQLELRGIFTIGAGGGIRGH